MEMDAARCIHKRYNRQRPSPIDREYRFLAEGGLRAYKKNPAGAGSSPVHVD